MSAIWDVDAKLLSLDYDPQSLPRKGPGTNCRLRGMIPSLKKSERFCLQRIAGLLSLPCKEETGSGIDPAL